MALYCWKNWSNLTNGSSGFYLASKLSVDEGIPITLCSLNKKKKFLSSVSARLCFYKITMFTCLEDYHIERYDLFREPCNGAG